MKAGAHVTAFLLCQNQAVKKTMLDGVDLEGDVRDPAT